MWMTKEKIGVVDKLQSSHFSGLQAPEGSLACKEIVSTICCQRAGPVHGLSWGTQALNSGSLLATF
jgi:hypothetical protein